MATSKKLQKKFEDNLDDDFKSTVNSAADEEIKSIVSKVALAEEENRAAKDADEDLANLKEQCKMAGENYATASKANRLKVQYCKFMLESRGK